LEKHFENRNYSAKNSTRKSFTEFGYRNLKLLRSLGPKLKLKSMMAQANGYEAYSRAFQNKTGLQADLHGNGMLMIITRKDIDYTHRKTSFRNTKKWYK
jgi:hypothetical protein